MRCVICNRNINHDDEKMVTMTMIMMVIMRRKCSVKILHEKKNSGKYLLLLLVKNK